MRVAGLVACLSLIVCVQACDDHCVSEGDVLWEPGPDEYRLELTNDSEYMVELIVDDESQGVYCAGVERLGLGNFPKSECSRIQAVFFDNPDHIDLDDCNGDPLSECEANNIDGKVCYNTVLVEKVEAILD